jgi:hypothetical protein
MGVGGGANNGQIEAGQVHIADFSERPGDVEVSDGFGASGVVGLEYGKPGPPRLGVTLKVTPADAAGADDEYPMNGPAPPRFTDGRCGPFWI